MRALLCLPAVLLCISIGCTSTDDPSMYLTGTEEYAITGPNGVPTCTNPKKTLICHIPPGNPANAHSICVGNPAVEPHMTHHGDTIGACSGGNPPPPDDPPDAGTPPPPPPPSEDGGIVL